MDGRGDKNKIKHMTALLEELETFLKDRPSITIFALCKEAGVPHRIWYYLLKRGDYTKYKYNFPEQVYKDKIRPIMAKYGHTIK